jgi:hypothetical protein
MLHLQCIENRLDESVMAWEVPALAAGLLMGAGRAAVAGSRQGIEEGERYE